MTVLLNSFESGSNGTTITTGNSSGTGINAFDQVLIGSGGSVTYDSTHSAHGLLSCNFTTTSSAIVDLSWSSSLPSNPSQLWFRTYIYLTANPSSPFSAAYFNLSGSPCATFQVNSSGKVQVLDSSGSTATTSSASVPLNKWFRIEGSAAFSFSSGQTQVKLFSSMDSSSAAETNTSGSINTSSAVDTISYGMTSSQASSGPIWIDDIGVSSTGYIGPIPSLSPYYIMSQGTGFF